MIDFVSGLSDIVKIGIAFEVQIIDKVPKDSFDIPVDFIFTERKLLIVNNMI